MEGAGKDQDVSKARRYQEVDEEISFKIPGALKAEPEDLPSTKPMNRYAKPMRAEEVCERTRDTVRKKLAHSMEDGLSDTSSTRSMAEHLESLYQQQAQLIVIL